MTPKNKNRLLVIGTLLIGFLSYRMAISKTFELKTQLNNLERQHISTGDLAVLSANLTLREKYTDSVLRVNHISKGSLQNSLLDFLNTQSLESGVLIKNFQTPHQVEIQGVPIVTFGFVLEGAYPEIEKLIYLLDQKYNFGGVDHISFKKIRNFRTQKEHLECQVLLTSYESN